MQIAERFSNRMLTYYLLLLTYYLPSSAKGTWRGESIQLRDQRHQRSPENHGAGGLLGRRRPCLFQGCDHYLDPFARAVGCYYFLPAFLVAHCLL